MGAGRVKDPAVAGKPTTAAATQKAGALGAKGKTIAVATVSKAAVEDTVATITAEEAKPEQGVKAEDGIEVSLEGDQVILIEVSSEELHDAPEHHEEDAEVPVSDVGSHEEDGSTLASPPIEGEEMHYVEGSVLEDEVSDPPLVSSLDHEDEHEDEQGHSGEEEHGSPQLSEGLREEILMDDAIVLPKLSEIETAEAATHSGVEEHLQKVVPPYQPSVLPTGEQVDEEKRVVVEGGPDDA